MSRRKNGLGLVIPIAAVFILLTVSSYVRNASPLVTISKESIVEPSVRTTLNGQSTKASRLTCSATAQEDTTMQQGNVTKFLHLSPTETMTVLTDIGKNDHYNDAHLRCSNLPSRQPQLYWYDYRCMQSPTHESMNATRRLLIVQSAGFGTYAQLLDLTAPINKAYARKWGHTMLVLQGTLVVLDYEVQTNCTPLEHRSTHNKMQLLKFGLRLRQHYDYMLILDADALIYDFSLDISNLMPSTAMMAANRAEPKKGQKKRATWKINAGITLWNLHHDYTQALAEGWTNAAVGYLNGRNNYSGDQIFLYHVLKNNATMEQSVYSFGKEFHYNKATVIKHIKRPHVTYELGQTALDSRSDIIETFTQEICQSYPEDCQELDKTKYSELQLR